jgi:hypothetical protein
MDASPSNLQPLVTGGVTASTLTIRNVYAGCNRVTAPDPQALSSPPDPRIATLGSDTGSTARNAPARHPQGAGARGSAIYFR